MSIIPLVSTLLGQFPKTVKKVDIWSDGPSSQFKNRFIVAALPLLQQLSNLSITWNYFASSNGKGAVDGIGGTIKRHVYNSVLLRDHNVQNSKSFERTAGICESITCLQMDSYELSQFAEKQKLKEIFDSSKQIAGIKSLHKLYLDSNGVLVTHLYEGEVENVVEKDVDEESIADVDIVEAVNYANNDENEEPGLSGSVLHRLRKRWTSQL